MGEMTGYLGFALKYFRSKQKRKNNKRVDKENIENVWLLYLVINT